MKRILLAAFIAAALLNLNYANEDKSAELTSDEVEIRQFNKCPSHQYFEIFKSKCMDCTPCVDGEFLVYKCSAFDNTICSTCDSLSFRYTAAYFKNCKDNKNSIFTPYRMRDGMTNYGITDKETPFKIISTNHLSALDSDESIEILPFSSNQMPEYVEPNNDIEADLDEYLYDEDDDEFSEEEDDESLEFMHPKPLLPLRLEPIDKIPEVEDDASSSSESSESDEANIKPESIEFNNEDSFLAKLRIGMQKAKNVEPEEHEEIDMGLTEAEKDELLKELHINDLISSEDTSEEDDSLSSESDEREDQELSEIRSSTLERYTAVDFIHSIKLALLSFTVVAVVVTLLLRCVMWCSPSREERVFTVIQPPELSPEQENDLIRSLEYVKTKRQFKYQPLEEFV